jgi:hypothetical protein
MHPLFQTFDEIQIGKRPVISIDTGLSIRGEQDGTDGFDASGIGRYELPPEGPFARADLKAEDAGGDFAGLVDVE